MLTNNVVDFKQPVPDLLPSFFRCLAIITLKAPNTTIAEFANTADPDETAHNEPSHLDLQCLLSKV